MLREFQQLRALFQVALISLLVRLYGPLEACLLLAPFLGLAFEKGGIDNAVEFVQIHSVYPTLESVTFGSQARDRFLSESRLLDVTLPERAGHPAEHFIIEGEPVQQPGELIGEDLFARVWLRALSLVARAVVVDILALLDLSNQRTAAVSAGDETREREVMFHTSMLGGVLVIEGVLHCIPQIGTDERLVLAVIEPIAPHELPFVERIAQDLVDRRDGERLTAPAKPESRFLRSASYFLNRVLTCGIPLEELDDQGGSLRLRGDDALALRSIDIAITQRRE